MVVLVGTSFAGEVPVDFASCGPVPRPNPALLVTYGPVTSKPIAEARVTVLDSQSAFERRRKMRRTPSGSAFLGGNPLCPSRHGAPARWVRHRTWSPRRRSRLAGTVWERGSDNHDVRPTPVSRPTAISAKR